jgi:hypothetical protein
MLGFDSKSVKQDIVAAQNGVEFALDDQGLITLPVEADFSGEFDTIQSADASVNGFRLRLNDDESGDYQLLILGAGVTQVSISSDTRKVHAVCELQFVLGHGSVPKSYAPYDPSGFTGYSYIRLNFVAYGQLK